MTYIKKFNDIFPANVVTVQDHPYIYSELRIDRDSIPDIFKVYDVRDDCDGQFWQIQDHVIVNYWATIIGVDPIVYNSEDGNSYICPPESYDEKLSSEGWFIDDLVQSPEDFIERYDVLTEKGASDD